jgi:hypothetical protein
MKDNSLMYVWFDFHHECRKMKWENLSKLIDIVKEKLNNYEYFLAKLDFGVEQRDKINDKTCQIFNK